MINEQWRAIPEYEGLYDVSDHGRVRRSLLTQPHDGTYAGRILQPHTVRGYKKVKLRKNNVARIFFVHQLVGRTFIANPLARQYINHIDGNNSHNTWVNLEWTELAPVV